jgi:ribosome-binding ATPase YchF (GTP1/OBG family)
LQERLEDRDQRRADPLQLASNMADSQREMHERALSVVREEYEKNSGRVRAAHEEELRRLEVAATHERQLREKAQAELEQQVAALKSRIEELNARL